jgi:hypothetical protein
VDLRIEFMKRVMKGETVAAGRREFGISRKTGDTYKQRFKRLGEAGQQDLSRAEGHPASDFTGGRQAPRRGA